MSAIPSHLRALAEHERVLSPEAEWREFLERNGGEPPATNCDERWKRWLRTAKRHPEPAREEGAPARSEMHATWQEPDDWDAARAEDPTHEHGLAACASILETLNALGGNPVDAAVKPKTPDPMDPLCPCGRLASNGPGSLCGQCAKGNR